MHPASETIAHVSTQGQQLRATFVPLCRSPGRQLTVAHSRRARHVGGVVWFSRGWWGRWKEKCIERYELWNILELVKAARMGKEGCQRDKSLKLIIV